MVIGLITLTAHVVTASRVESLESRWIWKGRHWFNTPPSFVCCDCISLWQIKRKLFVKKQATIHKKIKDHKYILFLHEKPIKFTISNWFSWIFLWSFFHFVVLSLFIISRKEADVVYKRSRSSLGNLVSRLSTPTSNRRLGTVDPELTYWEGMRSLTLRLPG